MRVLQQPLLEAFILARLRVAHDAGQQPHDRVEQRDRGRLAAGQDEVADGDLLQPSAIDDALVYPFEASAQDDGAGSGREFAHARLGQRFAARAHEQARARIAGRRDRVDRARQHVGAHHHAGAAAGRRIVDAAVLVGREVANLHGLKRPGALGQAPAG